MMNRARKEPAAGESTPVAPGDPKLRESQAKPPMTTRNAETHQPEKGERRPGENSMRGRSKPVLFWLN